jgi:hypothetical protein
MNRFNSLYGADTLPLCPYQPKSDNQAQPRMGWSRLYMQFSKPVYDKEIKQTVSVMLNRDEPYMEPRMIRKANYENEMIKAEMQLIKAHQAYVNNKPTMYVPKEDESLDFNSQQVQDKLRSGPDNNETTIRAIQVFEQKLRALNLSEAKQKTIRNAFYQRLLTADAELVNNLAKDELGRNVSEILQLIQKGDFGGGAANVIDAGEEAPIDDDDEPGDEEGDVKAPDTDSSQYLNIPFEPFIYDRIPNFDAWKHQTIENRLVKQFVNKPYKGKVGGRTVQLARPLEIDELGLALAVASGIEEAKGQEPIIKTAADAIKGNKQNGLLLTYMKQLYS